VSEDVAAASARLLGRIGGVRFRPEDGDREPVQTVDPVGDEPVEGRGVAVGRPCDIGRRRGRSPDPLMDGRLGHCR
jgi:hypothetical protein